MGKINVSILWNINYKYKEELTQFKFIIHYEISTIQWGVQSSDRGGFPDNKGFFQNMEKEGFQTKIVFQNTIIRSRPTPPRIYRCYYYEVTLAW